MKRTLLSIIFSTSIILLYAQNKPDSVLIIPKNTAYLTIGGASGALLSINYERRFLVSEEFFLTTGLAIGYNEEFKLCIFGPCNQPIKRYLIIPQHITANFGKARSFFEVGLGGCIIGGISTTNYLF